MLYIVGLGLIPKHLTKEAVETLNNADRVYLDTYTVPRSSFWADVLRGMVKELVIAERHILEDNASNIIVEAKEKEIVVAVPGDPFVATTHISLYLESLRRGVEVRYIPGISILTVAPSLSGLQHYRFGRVVTLPLRWRESPSIYEKILRNKEQNLHTLILVEEGLNMEEALEALLEMERRYRKGVVTLSDLLVGVARAGFEDCKRVVGTVEELLEVEWGEPPYTIILPVPDRIEEEILYELYRNRECV